MENKNVIINLKSNNTEKLENRLYNYLLNKNIIYGNSNKINLNKSKILNKKIVNLNIRCVQILQYVKIKL